MAPLCVHCANPGTADNPLAWDESGLLAHGGEDWLDKCPPLPAGMVQCEKCGRAVSTGGACAAAQLWSVIEERDDGWSFSRKGLRSVKPVPPFHDVISEPNWLDVEETDSIPEIQPRTKGLLFLVQSVESAAPNPPRPYAVCKKCAADWTEKVEYRPTTAGQAASASDKDYAAMIPADGVRVPQAMALWGKKSRATSDLLRSLVKEGRLTVEEVPTVAGGQKAKLYKRASS